MSIHLHGFQLSHCNLQTKADYIQKRLQELRAVYFAAHRFASSGFTTTPPEILATREATCRACHEWDAEALNKTGRCRKCRCSTWAKLRMATERCPLGKWEAVSEPLQ
jgi:predicted Zn-ribbon and HTH transcriptional regulator